MRTCAVLLLAALWVTSAPAQPGPFTVSEAVQAARQHHPIAQRANAQLDEARGERRATLSLDAPTLTLEYEGIPESAGLEAYEERRIAVSQEFDFPLRYLWQARRQNARVSAASYHGQSALLDLERTVRDAYITAWHAEQRLAVLDQYAASLDTQAQSFRRMHEVGRIADLDLSRANAEAAEVQSELRSAQADRDAARVRLANLTGRPGPMELGSPLLAMWEAPRRDDPVQGNPALHAARSTADAAGEEHTLAAMSWLPRIEAGGFRQHVPGTTGDADFWGVEVGLSVPVWYWWGGVGELQAASARKRAAAADVQQLQLELDSAWRAGIDQLAAARDRVDTYETTLIPTSESVRRLAQRSYEAGRAGYLDVLEAQRTLLQRRIGHLDAIRELALAQVTLDHLAGRSLLSLNSEAMER